MKKENLFDTLDWFNPKSSANSEEEVIFEQHAVLFNENSNVFNDVSTLFGLIRACIVLEGLLNKKTLDRYLRSYLPEQLEKDFVRQSMQAKLPYMEENGKKILIPTYPRHINELYANNITQLLVEPYDVVLKNNKAYNINPFMEYGYNLFDSVFTRLIVLDTRDEYSKAFYHPQFETVFIIGSGGSLIQSFPIFDEGVKQRRLDGMFDRLNLLLKYYYANDFKGFFENFVSLGFMSKSLFEEVEYKAEKRNYIREMRLKR